MTVQVQIVRLKEGLDVVTQMEYKQGEIELTNPMVFHVRSTTLMLQHWLPLAVMEGNSVMIPRDEVLCIMNPNKNFKEYYESMVSKLNSVLDEVREDSMEDMLEAFEELDNMDGAPIH